MPSHRFIIETSLELAAIELRATELKAIELVATELEATELKATELKAIELFSLRTSIFWVIRFSLAVKNENKGCWIVFIIAEYFYIFPLIFINYCNNIVTCG